MPIRPARSIAPARCLLGVALLAAALLLGSCGLPTSRSETRRLDGDAEARALLFADEFDGAALDGGHWQTEMAWGPLTDGQLERYDAASLTVTGGTLRIEARESESPDTPYASGAVASFGLFEFTYGYAEIRARMPEGRGLWPAFWLAASDSRSSAEIDVVEFLGHEPDTIHLTMHYDDASGQHHEPQETFRDGDFTDGFHTFGVDWRPGRVIWYVDGIERARQTHGVPNEPMYLIANLAVGGPWAGPPDDRTRFPSVYEVDWIRVYAPSSENGPSQPVSTQ